MHRGAPQQTIKPEKFLRLPEVEVLTALKKTSIYTAVHAGEFPPPVRIGARAVAWRESDILLWQSKRQQSFSPRNVPAADLLAEGVRHEL